MDSSRVPSSVTKPGEAGQVTINCPRSIGPPEPFQAKSSFPIFIAGPAASGH